MIDFESAFQEIEEAGGRDLSSGGKGSLLLEFGILQLQDAYGHIGVLNVAELRLELIVFVRSVVRGLADAILNGAVEGLLTLQVILGGLYGAQGVLDGS